MIVIIDYNMGNLGSIANMLKKVGATSCISNDIEVIMKADKIILPGVGSFDAGVANLRQLNLDAVLKDCVLSLRVPILGICLGMQLLTYKSEEGILPGLGFINATVKRFCFSTTYGGNTLKVPHMGWNTVRCVKDNSLLGTRGQESGFYFVHSYYVDCVHRDDIAGVTYYGIDFVSAFCRENIMGVQFHPEKSHKCGMEIFKKFIEI